jgi:hypothetical protein
MSRWIFVGCLTAVTAWTQEADSGFELRATAAAAGFYTRQLEAPPRAGNPLAGGFRTVLYPTWKLNRHWAVAGAIQTHSRPYFAEQFSTQGHGLETDILQAFLSYSRASNGRSLVFRAGQLLPAFGHFPLRYDDAENPMIHAPPAYGYYYKPVSTLGLPGAQVDVTLGAVDARVQFTNSSPANRRSLFDREQYGSWTGGLGYTIRQGLRVGASAYRGPYLHRQYAYYFPGEADPRDLPASGYGLDAQWGHGHWNVWGEWQRFQMAYRAIPTFQQKTGYVEARRVLHPRLYAAVRAAYQRSSAAPAREVYEVTGGLRLNGRQLLKIGYQKQFGPAVAGRPATGITIQFVTSLQVLSIARN